jgi:hypothetical protein
MKIRSRVCFVARAKGKDLIKGANSSDAMVDYTSNDVSYAKKRQGTSLVPQ